MNIVLHVASLILKLQLGVFRIKIEMKVRMTPKEKDPISISGVSLREVKEDGSLGPELMGEPGLMEDDPKEWRLPSTQGRLRGRDER